MPCFPKLHDEEFARISSDEREFVFALVDRAPDVLGPIRTQLDRARTCDNGNGWLVVRNARGEPSPWPEGVPFDIVPAWPEPGPHGCYDAMLWFDSAGQVFAVELPLLENTRIDVKALTAWIKWNRWRKRLGRFMMSFDDFAKRGSTSHEDAGCRRTLHEATRRTVRLQFVSE